MVEIGSQRLLANGWTTYSLGDTNSVRALQADANNAHQNHLGKTATVGKTTTQPGSSSSSSSTLSSTSSSTSSSDTSSIDTSSSSASSSTSSSDLSSVQYSHLAYSDQNIDSILTNDGFVPRLLKRYFELTARGCMGKEGVQNRSSATCHHGETHTTCLLENLFPLYCIVLIHLAPGAGPLIYPRQRLGRSLSISRADMLAASWAPDSPALSAEVVEELKERFGFILQTAPSELRAEMDGPGMREVGDVTIISSDMLYSMPTCSNLAFSVPKRQFDHASAEAISLPHSKRKRLSGSEAAEPVTSSTITSNTVTAATVTTATTTTATSTAKTDSGTTSYIAHATAPPTHSTATTSSSSSSSSDNDAPATACSVNSETSVPADLVTSSSTLYAYSIYQPKAEASLPPTYILNCDSTNKIRFGPTELRKALAVNSTSSTSSKQQGQRLSDEWKYFNER
jgi:hypothetical protein